MAVITVLCQQCNNIKNEEENKSFLKMLVCVPAQRVTTDRSVRRQRLV